MQGSYHYRSTAIYIKSIYKVTLSSMAEVATPMLSPHADDPSEVLRRKLFGDPLLAIIGPSKYRSQTAGCHQYGLVAVDL